MPTNSNDPRNSYTFDTAKRIFQNGLNAYASENDTPEGLRVYAESTRNQQNKLMAGINSHVILSGVNAEKLNFEWCELSGFEIVGAYGFVNFYYHPADDSEVIWRIGAHALQSGFPPEVIATLTAQLVKYNDTRIILCEDGASFSATMSDNGKYEEVKIKAVKNKRYKRNRRSQF